MKAIEGLIWIVRLILVTSTSMGNVEESIAETTTKEPVTESSTGITNALNVTNSPLDNGMVIRDIGAETSLHEANLLENPFPKPDTAPIVFPYNHKSFEPMQYNNEGEIQSRFKDPQNYQGQYETLYGQENFYDMKPIKFEENSAGNYFIPQTFEKNNNDDGGRKVEQSEIVLKPFPYAFERNKNELKDQWYPEAGNEHLQNYEDPEGFAHHKMPVGHFLFPQERPQYILHRDHHHHEDGRDDHHYHHDGGGHHEVTKESQFAIPWKKIGQLFTALVPLGLLLASLTPSVYTVDSAPASKTVRERSAEPQGWKFGEEDVLNLVQEYGIDSLSQFQCEDRVLCELARAGNDSSANSIEKGFWFLANETPRSVAEKAGMSELFEAIQTGNCELFKCKVKEKASRRG